MNTCLPLLMLALRMLSPNHSDERPVLTFEQRLQAREAIARVQYGHQLEATQRFEQAVPRWALQRDVRDMLEQSMALEEMWGVRVTQEMLQAEAARIARDTRLPERLAELHAALGDPILIEEALVRPVLVSRLFHERFDRDPVIQAGPRQEAEALASALTDGTLSPLADHPRRRAYEATAAEAGSPAVDTSRQLVTGKVMEEPGAFVVRAPFEQGGRQVIAEYAVPRVTWDEWRQSNANRLELSPGLVITTSAPSSLQSVELSSEADSCGSGDIWTDSILSQPGPITGAYQAIWTGSLYVVIASSTSMARYDPALDAWLPMSIAGAPVGIRPTAVWSGSEVILWGGRIFGDGFSAPGSQLGGRYNPVTNAWIPFGFSPLSRSSHTAVWTGSRMIVFGGRCEPFSAPFCESTPPYIGFPRYYGDGFSFDPATNTFGSIASSGLVGRSNHTAVWTGSRMIVWGGFIEFRLGPGADGKGWSTLGDGGIYDPADNSWALVLSSTVAQDRYTHSAVWEGSRMLVVGGASYKRVYDPLFGGFHTSSAPRDWVAALNPDTGIWQDLGAMPPYALGGKSVFTGRWLLTWGSASGGRFDPAAGVWSPITTVGAPVPRSDPAVGWDGVGMLVHGGNLGSTPLSDGGRYIPDLLSDADDDADGFSPCGGDCDDTNPAVNPLAEESCNGLDDDCDGARDEGTPGSGVVCGLTDIGQCSLGVTGCVDGAPACIGEVRPQPEICNGLDDDCDDEVPAVEVDADQDGYHGCAGDCDDSQAGTHPGAADLPGNLEDENCDGTAICSPESSWNSHGAYVLCVVNECVRLVDAGLATAQQCHTLIAGAAKSGVGRPIGSRGNGEGE